jgi:hypothetical protein
MKTPTIIAEKAEKELMPVIRPAHLCNISTRAILPAQMYSKPTKFHRIVARQRSEKEGKLNLDSHFDFVVANMAIRNSVRWN